MYSSFIKSRYCSIIFPCHWTSAVESVMLQSLQYSGCFCLLISSEKALEPHSSTLAWKLPWMEEPGGLQSMGSPRIGHDWATSLSLFTFIHWRRKWQPTPVFLPGESQGWRSLVGWRLWRRLISYWTWASPLLTSQISFNSRTLLRFWFDVFWQKFIKNCYF